MASKLLQLERDGADPLRERIRQRMRQPLEHSALSFRGRTSIEVRGRACLVTIDAYGRSWAPAGELLER